MQFNKPFIAELQFESANTKKMLSRVPFEHADWKPHEKSATLLGLARHVARIPGWSSMILGRDEVDFGTSPFPAFPELKNVDQLIAYHDCIVSTALESLESASDEDFMKTFTMRHGEKIFAALPKAAAIRNMAFNHVVHHRGQLSVFLRMLDVPIPGMYGMSADEQRAQPR